MTGKIFEESWFEEQFARVGKSQADLYHFLRSRLGETVDRSKVNKSVRGKRGFQVKELPHVWEFFGLDPASLATVLQGGAVATPEPRLIERPNPNARVPAERKEIPLSAFNGRRDVPVMGTAVSGPDGDFRFNGQEIDRAPRPPGLAHKRNVYAIHMTGESMEPRYEAGERLYVDPDRTPATGDCVLIELLPTEDGESGPAFVKRLVRRTPTRIVVLQFNPEGEIEFERDQIKLMHRIIPWAELLGV